MSLIFFLFFVLGNIFEIVYLNFTFVICLCCCFVKWSFWNNLFWKKPKIMWKRHKLYFLVTLSSVVKIGLLRPYMHVHGRVQRQETLDLPYLTLLCDNLKNRMFLQNFFSWHYYGNLLCFSNYPHHFTILQPNKFLWAG
jgi:hypothetical protein